MKRRLNLGLGLVHGPRAVLLGFGTLFSILGARYLRTAGGGA